MMAESQDPVQYAPTPPRREVKPRRLWPFALLAAGVFSLGVIAAVTYKPKYRKVQATDPRVQAIESQRGSDVDPSFRVTVGAAHKLGRHSDGDYQWWGEVDSWYLSVNGFSGKNLAFYPKKTDQDLFNYTGFGSGAGHLGQIKVSGLTALSVTSPPISPFAWSIGLVFRNENRALVIQAYGSKAPVSVDQLAHKLEITPRPSQASTKIQIQWPVQKP